jgi:hypothetical protein
MKVGQITKFMCNFNFQVITNFEFFHSVWRHTQNIKTMMRLNERHLQIEEMRTPKKNKIIFDFFYGSWCG